MVKIDKNVVTFASDDITMQVVIQIEEQSIKRLTEILTAQGTHFLEGYNARVFLRTPHGCIVLVPQ